MEKKYFNFTIICLIFLSFTTFLYAQNAIIYNSQIYDITLFEKDVSIKRIDRLLYKMNIKYKKDIASVILCVKYKDGSIKELYYIENGVKKYVSSNKPLEGSIFAESFYILLPNELIIDSINENIKLDNTPYDIVIKSVSHNKNVFTYNVLTKKIQPPKFTKPSLEISMLDKTYNTYTVYVKYSGEYEKPIALYYREGNMSKEYKYIPMIWSFDKEDAVGIKISDTYIEDAGKEMVVKLFFQMKEEDRYIYINAFDEKGVTETMPIEIILQGSGIAETVKQGIYEVPLIKSEDIKDENIAVRENNKTEKKLNIQRTPASNIEPKPYINILPRNSAQNKNDKAVVEPNYTFDNIKDVKNISDLAYKINSVISENKDDSLDLVFVLDATGSMKDAMKTLHDNIASILDNIYINYDADKIRIGFVFFKDSRDEYLTKTINYTKDRNYIKRVLKSMHISGGGDIPEPIFEAIQTALNDFNFEASKKLIIVITDAPYKENSYLTKDVLLNRMSFGNIKLEYLKLPETQQ